MSPPRRLTFRIRVEGARFVRVNIFDTRKEMLREITSRFGSSHPGEQAATLTGGIEPCLADLFFFWRGLRPNIIAHEASHAAWAVALATKRGLGPETEEFVAGWVDRITEKVWLKTQTAPL